MNPYFGPKHVRILLRRLVCACCLVAAQQVLVGQQEVEDYDIIASDELFQEAAEIIRSGTSSRNLRIAADLMKKAAVAGNPRAQYQLGLFYESGLGVRRSPKMAMKWFNASSGHRYPSAMYRVAIASMYGDGLALDREKAKELFSQIVSPTIALWIDVEEYGVNRRLKAESAFYLALIDVMAFGVDGNDSQKSRAVELLEKASRAGSENATVYLAMEYIVGNIVEADLVKGKEYLERYHLMLSDASRRLFEGVILGEGRVMTGLGNRDRNPGDVINAYLHEMIYRSIYQAAVMLLNEIGEETVEGVGTVLDMLQIAVDGGFVEAKGLLGILYCISSEPWRNYDKGYEYLSEAAGRDPRLAEYNLGVLFWRGLGVEEDRDVAHSHFLRASVAGVYAAQLVLDGDLEPVLMQSKDLLELCLEGRKERDPRALYSYTVREELGWGVSRVTYEYTLFDNYMKVARMGNAAAMAEVGERFFRGRGTARDDAKALDWLTRGTEQPKALFRLGYMYQNGLGVSVDLEKAFDFYQRSSDKGHVIAKSNLASMYYNGEYVEKDPAMAVSLWKDSTDAGYGMAFGNLGVAYHFGKGVEKNMEKAVEMYSKAAELGNINAAKTLVKLFELGKEVDKNLAESTYWMEKAGEAGDSYFMLTVAKRYQEGKVVPEDYAKALYWASSYLRASGAKPIRSEYNAYLVIADALATPDWFGYDPKAARKMYRDLERFGWWDSQFMLAKHYKSGALGDKVKNNAFSLFAKITKNLKPGDPFYSESAYELSRCYEEGDSQRCGKCHCLLRTGYFLL